MRLDTNNAASILIDGNPYRKDIIKVTYNGNNITIRDRYGLVYDKIAYGSITNGNTNAVFSSLAELKQWLSDHMYSSEMSASAHVAVAPHDSNNLPGIVRAIYVGVGGDVAAVVNGVAVVYKNVPTGTTLPIRATRINNTNTTATNMVALF